MMIGNVIGMKNMAVYLLKFIYFCSVLKKAPEKSAVLINEL